MHGCVCMYIYIHACMYVYMHVYVMGMSILPFWNRVFNVLVGKPFITQL